MSKKKSPSDAHAEALRRIQATGKSKSISLDLQGLKLTTLPPEIAGLMQLLWLDLRQTGVSDLTPLAELTQLQRLYLDQTGVSDLTPLAGLTQLQTLWLTQTGVSDLMPLAGLMQLKVLFLSQTGVSDLTPLSGLSQLKVFYLSQTGVSDLTPLSGLTRLRRLNLSQTGVSDLTPLAGLTQLQWLFLHGNPHLGLPPEVLGPAWYEVSDKNPAANPADILAYFFAGRSGSKRKLNEAKLLIVGEGEIGKSSLVERLLHGTFSPRKAKTEGISREIWRISQAPDSQAAEPIRVNIWDFGGQDVMHATHQFFLTKRSLYVLVLAGRGGENQGRLDYWLRAIKSYGGYSPVVIVANKADEHRLEININRIKADYAPNSIEFFQISCMTGEGVPELKRRLEQLVAGLENVNDEVPERFFTVKDDLEKVAAERNYLEKAEYLDICKRHKLNNPTEQELLIRFLHELGTVLNFDDPDSPYRVGDTHILNPEWVTEGVYDIINNHSLMQAGGVLQVRDLGKILKQPAKYPENKRPFIIEMMRKFEICVDFPDRQGTLLVPELLSPNQPVVDWDEPTALNFAYGYSVLPSGLIPRFIVRMFNSVEAKVYWRTGVVLAIDGCKALVRSDIAGDRVRVSIQGPLARRRGALTAIRSQFREIHATLPGFRPRELVPLPDAPNITVEYDHLLLLEEKRVAEFIPQGADKSYTVEELLNGIETPDAREQYRRHRALREQDEARRKEIMPRGGIVKEANPKPGMVKPALVVLALIMAIVATLTWASGYPAFKTVASFTLLFVGLALLFVALERGKITGPLFARYVGILTDKLPSWGGSAQTPKRSKPRRGATPTKASK